MDGYVAGDDAKAKQTVISLVESMGLRPLDVGPLSAARYLEGMAYLNIGLNAANGWSWTSLVAPHPLRQAPTFPNRCAGPIRVRASSRPRPEGSAALRAAGEDRQQPAEDDRREAHPCDEERAAREQAQDGEEDADEDERAGGEGGDRYFIPMWGRVDALQCAAWVTDLPSVTCRTPPRRSVRSGG